jgi:[ribosomal protein S18]-alanine N-acetyltransferase
MTWQLRRAVSADLDAIMAIESSVFESDAWSIDTMRAELADPHGYYLVAFPLDDSARIDAYAGMHAPLREPQADIQTIAVAPNARRRGLGRVLLLQLAAEARERGATEVFLEVRADNPVARALYDSIGFEPVAVRPRYYQPDGVDAIVMRHSIPAPRTGIAL